MEWRDTGILLSARKHGETALILDVFTPGNGRQTGVLRGGAARRRMASLQPGAQLEVTWRARLEGHMGAFTAEPLRSRMAAALADRLALSGLSAVCALLAYALPEREAHPRLYHHSEQLLDLLGQPALWPLAYLRWELRLLEEMGFGLDLSRCAVTGATEGLALVSPRSGRAVTRAGAGDWADRLLPLPPVLRGEGSAGDAEIAEALAVTGHFLDSRLAEEIVGRPLPAARAALVERIRARAA
jgi:DNA repair protein RecO (recombination protein O)